METFLLSSLILFGLFVKSPGEKFRWPRPMLKAGYFVANHFAMTLSRFVRYLMISMPFWCPFDPAFRARGHDGETRSSKSGHVTFISPFSVLCVVAEVCLAGLSASGLGFQ